MRSRRKWIVRWTFLAGVALALPACHGGASGVVVVIAEGFRGFPNSDWVVSGAGTTTVDGSRGTPAPSLATTATGSLAIRSTTQFGGPELTISADLRLSSVGATGTGSVAILDAGTLTTVARADVDAATATVTLRIGAASTGPIGLSAGGHGYLFSYSSSGRALWLLDGVTEISVTGFSPPALLLVSLENASNATYHFDSVVVTAP
jgi:hypothetical protein